MKLELKENGGLPAHILWTLAIVAGVSVANLYYNQPLLTFQKQTPIAKNKAKERLQEIYDTLGLQRKAKATDRAQ